MDRRRAIIISSQALFREGLRYLLSDLPDVELIGVVDSIEEARQLATSNKPDVIVISHEEDDQNLVAELLTMTDARLVTVTLEDGGMTVYHRRHLPEASVQELLKILESE